MENNNNSETEPIYANIDINIKDRATLYCTESRLADVKETANLRSLIEKALEEYMQLHPIKAKTQN